MTLPMTKGTGLLACASYMPGVRRNYWEGSRSSQILGGIHEATDDRACFTRWRLALRNAANRRLCRYTSPKSPKHGFIARAHTSRRAPTPPAGGPAFTPMAQARGPQPGDSVGDGERC